MSPREKRTPTPEELALRAERERLRKEVGRAKRGGVAAVGAQGEILKRQITQLTETKQRLSRLYFAQVEENRKRAQKLHKMLESIGTINSGLDLEPMLARLADTIQKTLGFRIVLVRLREPGGESFKAVASAGLEKKIFEKLRAQEIQVEEFKSWMREECRVSRSYFISHSHELSKKLPAGHVEDLGPRKAEEWHKEDVLLVPLQGRDGELVAYLSVDDPADRLVPSTETIEMLEIFGHHAVVGIENGRLYRKLEGYARDLEDAGKRNQELNALKTNFVATVSHELRTPLTAIRAYLDSLMALSPEEMQPDRIQHFLQTINDEAGRLSRLIESVLDLSRFDSRAVRVERQPVELAQVIEETLKLLDPIARAGQVRLKVDRRVADSQLNADRDQMRQLLLHLGSNAVKFTPPEGKVTIILRGDQRELTLCVEDTGIGIPAESLGRVFERFYQVDSSAVRRYGGVGLGLAICKSIVESHGGRLSVESAPGRGSRFTAIFPRVLAPAAPTIAVRQGSGRKAGEEDVLRMAIQMVSEVMNARVVSLLSLEPDGHLVVEAALGLEEQVVRQTRIKPGSGVASWVAQNRRPVCVSRPEEKSEVAGSGRSNYRSGTFLSVPLEGGTGPIGVINVTDPVARETFGAEDCHMLLQLASGVARAWEHVRSDTNGDAANPVDGLLDALSVMQVGGGSTMRARLARAIARACGLTESEIGAISYGAGESGGDDNGEAEGIVEARVTAPPELEHVSLVRDMVLSQHEWWDGSGYPRGLKESEIPIGGRILALVDAWERMTVGRPHRPSRSREEALEEVRRLKGRQFDPAVVDAFERVLPEVEPSLQRTSDPEMRDTDTADTGR